jgi:hypothetical protein
LQNVDIIRVESDVDILSEDDSIGMHTDEVYIPSTFFIVKTEPKVSFSKMAVFWLVLSCRLV